MNFPWQDNDGDGQPDDPFGDTWLEIFGAWLAVAVSFLVFVVSLYLLTGGR